MDSLINRCIKAECMPFPAVEIFDFDNVPENVVELYYQINDNIIIWRITSRVPFGFDDGDLRCGSYTQRRFAIR